MERLVAFAYAPVEELTSASLAECLAVGDGHGTVAMPLGPVTAGQLQDIQRELRTLLEDTEDGRLPAVTTTTQQYLAKPPGPTPRRLAAHYRVVISGEWRDVVLTFACRLLSMGKGDRLTRCAVCKQVFVARRKTATICSNPECRNERNRRGWKRWIGSPEGRRTRRRSLLRRYERQGWTLGARGGLGGRRRPRGE
jgi:hypothetical protein